MSSENKLLLLYVTCGSADEALSISRSLVEKKLAACGNVVPRVISVYQWEGKVQEDTETLLFIKTTAQMVESAKEEIEKIHSYDTPCIAQIETSQLNSKYFQWCVDQCSYQED